jgi:hypothetical protein
MSRIHRECPASDPCDRSAAADLLLRQEPDEEEDEEETKATGKTKKMSMMTTRPTTATRSERRTCLDFAQADDGQKEPHQSCQCDSGSPGVKIAISPILSMSATMV